MGLLLALFHHSPIKTAIIQPVHIVERPRIVDFPIFNTKDLNAWIAIATVKYPELIFEICMNVAGCKGVSASVTTSLQIIYALKSTNPV